LSGIEVKVSVAQLIEFKHSHRCVEGPTISDLAGNVLSHQAMNDALLKVLEELFDTHQKPSSIPDKETMRKIIQVYRLLQRTSDMQALEQKVGQSDIDVVYPWKALECANGKMPQRPIWQHYAKLELLLGPFLLLSTWAM
jgi:hypothetical protein